MRILFHHRIASRDGQAVHIEELIAALRRQGHDTLLVGPPAFGTAAFGTSNLLIDLIKRLIPNAIYELLEIIYNLRAFLRLRAAVKAYRPDVIYERFSLFLFAGLWVRRGYGLPLLLEVNSPLFEERATNDGLRLLWLGRWAQRFLWLNADHVLPVSGVLAGTVNQYGVPGSRITIIPNGVDPDRFSLVAGPALAKRVLGLTNRVVLGFTGFIRQWNAIHRLIDFVASHREDLDLHILVVGDGPARQSLEEYARLRSVSGRFTITGVVPREDVARYIAAFDIAVIPGLTPYSSPLKLFEFLQLGRAIVAPNTDNIREILTNDHDAILFESQVEGSLEKALLRLSTDPMLRAAIGKAARETIKQKSLTWDHNAEQVVAIAENLLARPRSANSRKKADLDAKWQA